MEEDKTISSIGSQNRPRDEKGHFLPKDTCKKKEVKEENTEDPTVVKFKVVKEKKTKFPKNIVGKLNDMKERYASKFIDSVITNKPQCLVIDDVRYYTEDYLKSYKKASEEAIANEQEAVECMNSMRKQTGEILGISKSMLKGFEECNTKRIIWKSLALGLISGMILVITFYGAKSYVNDIGKTAINTPSVSELTTIK